MPLLHNEKLYHMLLSYKNIYTNALAKVLPQD